MILEQFADNPFIAKFYENPDKYALPFELFFVAERFKQLNELTSQQDFFYNHIISDYLFIKSLLFSSINLTDDEFKLYKTIFDIIYKTIPKPDLIVYLNCTTNKLMTNIANRGRTYEQNIKEDYLSHIQQQYFTFFKSHPELRVLIIDVENLDFMKNHEDLDFIEKLLDVHYSKGLSYR